MSNACEEQNIRWPGEMSIIIEPSGNRATLERFFFFFPGFNSASLSVLASQATCKRYRGDGNSRWSSQKTTGSRCGHSRNRKILRPLTRATKPRNSTKGYFPFATLHTHTYTQTHTGRGGHVAIQRRSSNCFVNEQLDETSRN